MSSQKIALGSFSAAVIVLASVSLETRPSPNQMHTKSMAKTVANRLELGQKVVMMHGHGLARASAFAGVPGLWPGQPAGNEAVSVRGRRNWPRPLRLHRSARACGL